MEEEFEVKHYVLEEKYTSPGDRWKEARRRKRVNDTYRSELALARVESVRVARLMLQSVLEKKQMNREAASVLSEILRDARETLVKKQIKKRTGPGGMGIPTETISDAEKALGGDK